MFTTAPNARQIAKILYDGKHQYASAQDIADAYLHKTGYLCTAIDFEDAVAKLNVQKADCFLERVIHGERKFAPNHYLRWYPEGYNLDAKSYSWSNQFRTQGNQQVCDYYDLFYHEWLMGGCGCPILFQASFYTLCNPELLRYPTNLLHKLADWAELGTDAVGHHLQAALVRCWQVRQERDAAETLQVPIFMSWVEFLRRMRIVIGIQFKMADAYNIWWDDAPDVQQLLDRLERITMQVNLTNN